MTALALATGSARMGDPVTALTESLSRTDKHGERVFAAEDVRHALPLIVLGAGLDASLLSPGMQDLMAETLEAAGVADATDEEKALEALAGYYRAHPVAPAILEEIRRAFAPEGGAQPSAAIRHLVGSTPVPFTPTAAQTRPPGSIPGPLSRLKTMKSKSTKDD